MSTYDINPNVKNGVITLIGKNRPPHVLKVYVKCKADIMKRLGRSPDRGDAVVYGGNAGDLDAGPRARTRGRSAIRPTPQPVRDYDEIRYG